MTNIIELNKVCYYANQECILNNISWKVKSGERWVVFGLNGSGKTTLLSAIAGYNGISSGDLKVFGERHSNENIYEHRRKIGWVSSSFFDKYLTNESVLDIVLSGVSGTLSLNKNICDDDVKRAIALLESFNLGNKLHQPFKHMSKGQRQGVIIARALISSPQILILDEPVTGFDIVARTQMLETIRYLAQDESLTIIYVTHYTEELLPEFNKVMLLKKGKIEKIGLVNEIFTTHILSDFLEQDIDLRSNEGCLQLFVKEKSCFIKEGYDE